MIKLCPTYFGGLYILVVPIPEQISAATDVSGNKTVKIQTRDGSRDIAKIRGFSYQNWILLFRNWCKGASKSLTRSMLTPVIICAKKNKKKSIKKMVGLSSVFLTGKRKIGYVRQFLYVCKQLYRCCSCFTPATSCTLREALSKV